MKEVFCAYFGREGVILGEIYKDSGIGEAPKDEQNQDPDRVTEKIMLDFLEGIQILIDTLCMLSSFGDKKSDHYKKILAESNS